MNDALGSDVNVTAGRHLAVPTFHFENSLELNILLRNENMSSDRNDLHSDAESKHFVVLVATGIIRNDHSVCDDDSRPVSRRREQSQRMARVHH